MGNLVDRRDSRTDKQDRPPISHGHEEKRALRRMHDNLLSRLNIDQRSRFTPAENLPDDDADHACNGESERHRPAMLLIVRIVLEHGPRRQFHAETGRKRDDRDQKAATRPNEMNHVASDHRSHLPSSLFAIYAQVVQYTTHGRQNSTAASQQAHGGRPRICRNAMEKKKKSGETQGRSWGTGPHKKAHQRPGTNKDREFKSTTCPELSKHLGFDQPKKASNCSRPREVRTSLF